MLTTHTKPLWLSNLIWQWFKVSSFHGSPQSPVFPCPGAVKPASTYSASLAIKFGTDRLTDPCFNGPERGEEIALTRTKMASKSYFESMKKMRKPHRPRPTVCRSQPLAVALGLLVCPQSS